MTESSDHRRMEMPQFSEKDMRRIMDLHPAEVDEEGVEITLEVIEVTDGAAKEQAICGSF